MFSSQWMTLALPDSALPDRLLQSALFTLPCRGGPSSAESAAGVQHSLLYPQPHSEHPVKKARREPDPPPKLKTMNSVISKQP